VAVAGSTGAHVVLLTAPVTTAANSRTGSLAGDSASRLAIYNGIVKKVAAASAGTSLINLNALACPGGQYEQTSTGAGPAGRRGPLHRVRGNAFAPVIWPEVFAWGNQQRALAYDRGLPTG